jgi:hypothetical protein
MELRVSIQKRHLLYLIITLAILTGINYAIAENGSPNPGHSADEIGEGTIGGVLTISNGSVIINGTIKGTDALKVYQKTCESARCAVACDPGDLLVSCSPATDPEGVSYSIDIGDDMDTSVDFGTMTCAKGENDPKYWLRIICLDLA